MESDYAHTCCRKLGQRIRTLRDSQGLSVRDLGMMSGVDYSYLSNIENARVNPTVSRLAKIASGLGVELWELFAPEEKLDGRGRVDYYLMTDKGFEKGAEADFRRRN